MIIINPISPVAFSVLGFDVRWYALAYIAAFVVGYFLFKKFVGADNIRPNDAGGCYPPLQKKQMDDLLTYVILGVILGGRLGYVLFYNLPYFMAHPLEIFAVWMGGMSFHGGLLGVVVSVFLFSWFMGGHQDAPRANLHSPLRYTFSILDIMAVIGPIGLFFGRIANFINMELMGHATNRPWGVIFNGYGNVARHPSPLYEAALEGIVLFTIMFGLWRFTRLRERPGALSGVFAMGYAAARFFVEFFRVPDVQLGYLLGTNWLTMGMVLSALMFAAGLVVFTVAIRKK